eukprot:m.221782 g.221782  ORF g.221782 m.221782 type:complete len:57 (+) comp25811_c0_seq1:1562-1732(+)
MAACLHYESSISQHGVMSCMVRLKDAHEDNHRKKTDRNSQQQNPHPASATSLDLLR